MKVQDSAAIVTGGASGVGAATVRLLASMGAKVTLLDQNGETIRLDGAIRMALR